MSIIVAQVLEPPAVPPIEAELLDPQPIVDAQLASVPRRWRWYQLPRMALSFVWDLGSLIVLLAIATSIPVVQLASLGYLLRSASNLSSGKSWSTALPGRRLAGRFMAFLAGATLLWLPVWMISVLAYQAQLLQPNTIVASAWRLAAFLVSFAWMGWVTWAAMRGGRWRHLFWPAPILFLKRAWRPSTWSRAIDDLWDLYASTHFFELWWLGTRAAVAALVWLSVPVSLMIIGLRAQQMQAAGLVGLVGAVGLAVVMLYLPQMQIYFAETNRFSSLFAVGEVRRRFRNAPIAITFSIALLVVACIPIYLLRIEATPQELAWLPCLVYVALMLPAKIVMGAAMGYAARRPRPRHWILRWSSRLLTLGVVFFYVGTLYVAQLVAWQGVYVMYAQHSVLVPTPLISP